MREPVEEKNRIDVRWGWLLLWIPFLPWVFGEAEAAGLALLMVAGGLFVGHVITAVIDARNERQKSRARPQASGPESSASAPRGEAASALPGPPPAWLTRRR